MILEEVDFGEARCAGTTGRSAVTTGRASRKPTGSRRLRNPEAIARVAKLLGPASGAELAEECRQVLGPIEMRESVAEARARKVVDRRQRRRSSRRGS